MTSERGKRFASSFRKKLLTGAGVLALTICALAALLYVSTERYQYHLERSVKANQVLTSFQSVSDHTYRKLNAVGQIVASGAIGDVGARVANERLLLDAVAETQTYLEEENAFDPQPDFDEKLNRLKDIEAIVARIIEGGAAIREAVESGDRNLAQAELTTLQSAEFAGRFNRLIDAAIRSERKIVEATQADAVALGDFIARFLPAAILITLVLGSGAAVMISRSLRTSLSQLQAAADAYSSGDLEHRVELPDVEFNRLADAFNRMAAELAARRAEARQSRASLERQVEERTQELSHTLGQLRSADATRRKFLAEISHELRTPLTLIQGEAEMVMRGAEKSPAEYQEALTRVRDQAIHTNRLVKDLLFIARSEEGNLHIERRSVDIVELVNDVCGDFRSALVKKGLRITSELPSASLWTKGDPDRLRQLFAIMLDNAIRYSDAHQDVSIRLVRAGEEAVLSIRDRGARLSSEDVTKVFDRFYRGSEAVQRSEGSGLGLPVAKAIVEAHDGAIALRAEDDGVSAVIRLPVEEAVGALA